jgi:hypothetical protein
MFPSARPAVTPDAAPPLRVVIFYTDLPAADRALRALRDALDRRGEARTLHPALWNTALLDETPWLRLAAADIADAELCVLSLGDVDPRANDTAVWLRELAPRLARHWVTLEAFETPATQRELLRQAV